MWARDDSNFFSSSLPTSVFFLWRLVKMGDQAGDRHQSERVQAVIVEAREHEGLRPVLENMCEKLPDVPITLVHGTHNGEFARRAADGISCVVDMHQVNAVNLDAATYSKLVTSETFWDALGDREKTLIFQTDSGICGEGAELADYLQYDYCGAPWEWDETKVGGNGGFSLRNTAASKRHIRQHGPEQTEHEDFLFVQWCKGDPDCTLCPYDVGRRFATETLHDQPAWAFHNNMSYGGAPQCDFNAHVHALNSRAKPLGNAPDASTWRPQLTRSSP